jgi:hypothetical protein
VATQETISFAHVNIAIDHMSGVELLSRPRQHLLDRLAFALRQLRTHPVQGAVRIHETKLSHSIVRVTSLTETTLNSASGPFRSDGIGI